MILQKFYNETKCLTCKNCDGACSWSHNKTPVDGWTVKESTFRDMGKTVNTYRVVECPQYEYYGACTKCKYYDPNKGIPFVSYKEHCNGFVYSLECECRSFKNINEE